METRELFQSEIDESLCLVWNTFLEFEAPDYDEKGVKTFEKCLSDKDFLGRLKFYGAFELGKLIGVIATRNEGNHIALFFVNKDHHKQGVGRDLFEYILPESASEKMTVNSSPYAVKVYQKLGFHATDAEQITDGIRFTPMEFVK